MAYDDQLAGRVRSVVADEPALAEKRMFGGLAFLIDGNLAISASSKGGLLVRVDPSETESLVNDPLLEPFEIRRRALSGWLHVTPTAVETDRHLALGATRRHIRPVPRPQVTRESAPRSPAG